jgi:hypothetical protein
MHITLGTVLSLLLAACGGGGSTSGVVVYQPLTTTIQGVVAKGLVKGGTVSVYSLPANGDISQRQKLIPDITTNLSDASFTANIGTYTGTLLLEATGTYRDESDGVQKSLSIPLRAAVVIASGGGTVYVAITPFTEIAVRTALTINNQVGTFLSGTAVTNANALLTDLFPFNILSDLPVEPINTIMNAVSQPRRDYTLALAALAKQAAFPSSLNAVVEEYRLDLVTIGRLSPLTVADFQTALTSFLGSPYNQTGITAPTAGLLQVGYYTTLLKLNLSGQFASGTLVNGVQLTLAMPSGITVQTDSQGIPLPGVITASGVAASGSYFEPSMYDAVANTISIVLLNNFGFGSGEFSTVSLRTSPSVIPAANNFSVANTKVVTRGGLDITSASTITVTLPN